jgi:hypothetical protein
MRKLPKPVINLEEHLNNCISRCKINRIEMQNFIPQLMERAGIYDEKAINGELFSLRQIDNFNFEVTSLVNLYNTHMVKKGSIGRPLYDKLIISAKGICPFCAEGRPTTIDHFLPKDESNGFPELSIVPINLVPCCKDCNHIKSSKSPITKEEQLIHPYYDDINQDRWLYTNISYQINDEPALTFYVNCPDEWDETLQARVRNHFKLLDLNLIYSQQAANEFSGISHYLNGLFIVGGEDAVKEHLLCEAISREAYNKNSWQTAMYYALSENDNLCSIFT